MKKNDEVEDKRRRDWQRASQRRNKEGDLCTLALTCRWLCTPGWVPSILSTSKVHPTSEDHSQDRVTIWITSKEIQNINLQLGNDWAESLSFHQPGAGPPRIKCQEMWTIFPSCFLSCASRIASNLESRYWQKCTEWLSVSNVHWGHSRMTHRLALFTPSGNKFHSREHRHPGALKMPADGPNPKPIKLLYVKFPVRKVIPSHWLTPMRGDTAWHSWGRVKASITQAL